MGGEGAVLVTGAAGFGGSHLVEELLRAGQTVVALDLPGAPTENLAPVRDRVEVLACDLAATPSEGIAAALGGRAFRAVYHLAGLASVRRSFEEARRTLEVNAFGALNLLGALGSRGAPTAVLLVGSAEEYGAAPDAGALTEQAPLAPVNPYALSKVWQETLGAYCARTTGLRVQCTRTFNHTGPRQSADFVCADFARQIARSERGLQEPLLRVGNLAAARDFLDVRDVAAAYRLIVERGAPGAVYNVCSGRARRIEEILRILVDQAAVPIRIETDPARLRPVDVPVLAGDPSRLRRDTGWEPRIALETSLADLLRHWRGRVAAEPGDGAPAPGGPRPAAG